MTFEKPNHSLFMLTLVAMLALTPQCYAETSSGKTSIEDVQQETKNLVQTLKAYTVDQRDEAIQKTKAALDTLDTRIEALETRIDNNWDKLDAAAREKARASLKELRSQRTQVAEWYGSLKSSSGDAWEHMKEGFSAAYTALQDAWEKAEKDLSSAK